MRTVVLVLPSNRSRATSANFRPAHNGFPSQQYLVATAYADRSRLDAEIGLIGEAMDKQQEPQDERRVAVNESWALRYWARELGVTEKDLRETVEVVGPRLGDVKKILSRH